MSELVLVLPIACIDLLGEHTQSIQCPRFTNPGQFIFYLVQKTGIEVVPEGTITVASDLRGQLVEVHDIRCCHTPNRFGTVDIGIISPAFRKLKSFFKNIFIGLKHLELRKRKIADVIPRAGYNEFKKDSDANDMTVQQYYHETYNIHIK